MVMKMLNGNESRINKYEKTNLSGFMPYHTVMPFVL